MIAVVDEPHAAARSLPEVGFPQVIRSDEIYSLAEFCRRVGIGPAELRGERRAGMRIVTICGREFVRGRDWFSFAEKHTEHER